MKKLAIVLASSLTALFLLAHPPVAIRAEDKPPPGRAIPRLGKTPDDPVLIESRVYPFWGPICQRYTYSVIYQDKEGRPPEYVQIYFNGDWIDIEKEDPEDNNYQRGVKYIYKFVPKKIGPNFYFFEASNGVGKARDGIIDSPDNGPVLFESAFDNNEIALINAATGEKVWSFPTGEEWVGGMALSNDGKYLAAQTSNHVYLFDTNSAKPRWAYTNVIANPIGGDVKGGVAISADGSRIAAFLSNHVLLFSNGSNQPLWQTETGNAGYNIAISANGEYLAAATCGDAEIENGNNLILWHQKSSEQLWQYHASGNFHDVSLSHDGQFIAGATGCPDRRGYLFSKDSNEPLWRSEMLTRDSPIHQAKISADGSLAAFGAESEGGALHLFSKEAGKVLWKFAAPGGPSFRAVSLTPNGKFAGGATTGRGGAYIFASDSQTPLASWKVDASLGAADLADDGSFLAVGGTDNKVHIFEQESKQERAVANLGEFVGEIDISGNGQYIAAGTSGSVYFFETLDIEKPAIECAKIIEPEPDPFTGPWVLHGGEGEGGPGRTYCGNGLCEDPLETLKNCPQDCDPNYTGDHDDIEKRRSLPPWLVWIFGGGFLASLLGLGGYLIVLKIKERKDPSRNLNGRKGRSLPVSSGARDGAASAEAGCDPENEESAEGLTPKTNRKVVIGLSAAAAIFAILITATIFITRREDTITERLAPEERTGVTETEKKLPDRPIEDSSEEGVGDNTGIQKENDGGNESTGEPTSPSGGQAIDKPTEGSSSDGRVID